MSTLTVPVKVVTRVDSNFDEEEKVIRFLSKFDGGLLPDNVNGAVYRSFLKTKDYTHHRMLILPHLSLKIKHGKNDRAKLQGAMIRTRDELKRRFGIEALSISGRSRFKVLWKKNHAFECFNIIIKAKRFLRSEISIKLKMIGRINLKIVKSCDSKLYGNAREIVEKICRGIREVDEEILAQKSKKDAANFIFVRSLLDFINSAPSDSFSLAFFRIDQAYPFLFKPFDPFWDTLLKENPKRRNKTLAALLLGSRGLTMQSFENIINWWVEMIVFLREECNGNAGDFFKVVASKLGIDRQESYALEAVQSLLENYDEIGNYLRIAFPYSLKAGRLFLTMMTKTARGYNLMNGVSDEHVRALNLPVDAQVLRVALNTGLIEVKWVKTERVEFKGNVARVLRLQRRDMTELARVAWKLVADNIDVPPVELDYIIYSVGSLFCNTFGKMCYACPLTDICSSWKKKKIMEGSGVDWSRTGMFSYGKGVFDALVFRPCPKCKGKLSGCRHKYSIETFSSEQSKIDFAGVA